VSTTSEKDITTKGLQMLLMSMATISEISDAGSGHFKICEIVDCSGEWHSLQLFLRTYMCNFPDYPMLNFLISTIYAMHH